MQKNVAGQKWYIFAFDETDNTAKAGDAANITANLRIDAAAANAVDDANPTELEDGYYVFDITQAESNGDYILLCPESATANIQVIGVPGAFTTTAPNYNVHLIDSNGRLDVIKVAGTTQTANDNGADINTLITQVGTAGDGLTAINLPNQTMDIAGNITGNLSGSVGSVTGAVGSVTGHTNQTGDSFAVVNHADHGNAKLVRSTTPANKLDVSATGEAGLDFANVKDAAAHTTLDISVNVALDTTLAVRTDDSIFTISAGSTANDAYNNMVLALYDVSGSLWETRKISDYVGASKTITVDSAFTFTVAANDVVKIFMSAYAPTVAAGGGATAQEVHEYDVSGITTPGYAGYEIQQRGGRYG